jgi:hypothetical protein
MAGCSMKHVGPVVDLVLKMDAQRILAPDLQYLSSHVRGVCRAHDRQDESWKPNALPDENDFSVKWPANSPDRITVSAVIDRGLTGHLRFPKQSARG